MKSSKYSFVVSPYARPTKKGKAEPIKVNLKTYSSLEHIPVQGTTRKGPHL